MTSPDEQQHHDDESAMIKRAAQRYGTVGAMLAGGMVVFDKLLGRKPKEEAAIVVEASGEPGDIDVDGINFVLEEDVRSEITIDKTAVSGFERSNLETSADCE